MRELSARAPLFDHLPLSLGTVTLSEVDPGVMTSLAPFRACDNALSAALKAAHGMAAPGPNRAAGKEGARAVWFGRRMFLLMGPEPDRRLAEHAVLSDQSDAWTVLRLEGLDAADVLARVVPIDLRREVFKRGHTARTDLQHMMASVTRVGEAAYLVLVFRSMGRTLLHDLRMAMESVAARAR